MSCADARERVLEDRRLRRLHSEPLRGDEVGVRSRLPAEMLLLGHEAVDPDLEEILDPGCGEHLTAVLARRDDGAAHAGSAGGDGVADGALVRLDALASDQCEHEVVLAVRQPADRLELGTVVVLSARQPDAARLEKRAHAVVTRLSVDVLVVVRQDVEGHERGAVVHRALAQERVEDRLPRLSVHRRRLRQHAVDVEQTGPDSVGQAESGSGHSHDARSWSRRSVRPSITTSAPAARSASGRPMWSTPTTTLKPPT